MSEHHPPSNSHTENKEDIPLTSSQENQPLSATPQSIMALFDPSLPRDLLVANLRKALISEVNSILSNRRDSMQSIMAAPFDSSPPKGYEAAGPKKALNSAEILILINDDSSNQSDTHQTKDLVIPTAKWKGKGKATEADYACWEQENNAARTLLTLSRTICDMPIETSDDKMKPDQRATFKMAPGTPGHGKELPTEIWVKIWTLVANNNPRNLDIWTSSVERDETSWINVNGGEPIVNDFEDLRNCSRGDSYKPFKFTTTQIVPPILHVSSLSRHIGLKYYRLGFGCNLGMTTISVEDYPIFEPRIYYHAKNDLVCPMGRFKFQESDCFWDQFPEEISAIALNLGTLMESTLKLFRENEGHNSQRAHQQFCLEDWNYYANPEDPTDTDEMMIFFANNKGEKFLKRASKIYLYYFTDDICKRGTRDFRFTQFVDSPNGLRLYDDVKSDFCIDLMLHDAEMNLRLGDLEGFDSYQRWVLWLRYGGLTWLKGEGPRPHSILPKDLPDNATEYDQDKSVFFAFLPDWEELELIRRGVPNIGIHSLPWLPGIPEIHYTKLEIHG
ncbi:hypothetical protein EAE96_007491 [Botrytis aclada]|nr:hypothetical protein EAE96_007491 [Botrytis aclada]